MINIVRGMSLPLVGHPQSRARVYPHQAAMFDSWERQSTLLLASKTGSGKTRAAMLPILKRGEYAVAVYPTNELVRDQVRSVEVLAAGEGVRAAIYTPERQGACANAECLLVPLDGDLLDRWQGRMRSRAEALRRLLNRERPRIIFTNPDILFNILCAQYHLDALEPLSIYETVVFDEFHLYQGVELAHALMMVALARGLGFFSRVVLLSATPDPDVQKLLSQTLSPAQIPMAMNGGGENFRTAVHDVHVRAAVASVDPVDQIADAITKARHELGRLREEHPENTYIPAVAVVNSVLDAIRLEDEIVRRGIDRKSLAIIRGLSHRSVRERSGKWMAIGTSAIEVGVDFDCDLLFFEALEAASFLQRFGRAGRHRVGRAIMFVPSNVIAAMEAQPEVVDRSGFEEMIHTCYAKCDPRPWFVASELGLLTGASIAERLYETVARGRKVAESALCSFRKKLDGIFEAYATSVAPRETFNRVQAKLSAHRRGCIPAMRWYAAYLKLNRFRTSMPSVEVHDWREHSRRGEWKLGTYEVDLATLLRRGRNIRRDSVGRLFINGIGSSARVNASEAVSQLPHGVLLRTAERRVDLFQNGTVTPASDYLSSTDHIFTVVPRNEVEQALDWRLVAFEAGKCLVAFDGAALLLVEIWKRSRGS